MNMNIDKIRICCLVQIRFLNAKSRQYYAYTIHKILNIKLRLMLDLVHMRLKQNIYLRITIHKILKREYIPWLLNMHTHS